ncbi:hypothetical protein [Chromobacterium sp. CV08]|uniref:hypothetical protein n=1 Tax=Chromobacterium sp. CV08 TaxID=3133274 RepID=UPI003DA88CDA
MIRCAVPAGYADGGNIMMSHGVVLARETLYKDTYLNHAFIPDGNWNQIDKIKLSQMVDLVDGMNKFEVAIFELENKPLNMLLSKSASPSPIESQCLEAEKLFFQALNGVVSIQGETRYLGVETTRDSSPTITWDNKGIRTGLHVDCWYDRPISERANSENRLCLNIGAGDRYFLFSLIPIVEMREHVAKKMKLSESELENPTNICAYFFLHYPDTPILAFKNKPGQGYIASTEYLCHDGFVPGRHKNASISIMANLKLLG